MSVFSPLQTSFAGGELSPRLGGRVDADLYRIGLAVCENLEPLAQGPLLMRNGSVHVRALTGDERTRLVPIRMANGQDYLLELLDHLMRLYSVDGDQVSVEYVSNTELVQNGDFSAAGGGWEVFSKDGAGEDVTFSDGKAHFYLSSASAPGDAVGIRQTLTLTGEADLVIDFAVTNRNVSTAETRMKLGTTPGGSELALYQGAPTSAIQISVHALAGNLYLSFEIVDGGGTTVSRFDLDDVSVKATATGGGFDIVTPWSADQVRDVQYVSETGADRTIFVHPNCPPFFLKYSGANAWDFDEVEFTARPAEWSGTNWPGTIEIHSGRAYYGGTPAQRNRFWASRPRDPVAGIGGPFDLTIGANPGDTLDFEIATKGAIRWMRGSRVLLVGTDLGEHSVSGSKGVPLVGDTHVRRESAFGSSALQAVDAGTHALYVSSDRRKIRALAYDLQTSGWESKDVTFAAEHITEGLVQEVHHAWTPDSLLVVKLETGELVLCTFVPGEQVVAWWRAPLASGPVRSAAVSQGPAGAFLWMAVERGGGMHLERLELSRSGEERYLDASVAGVVAAGELAGLDHLEGLAVTVLVGGAVLGEYVVAGGKVVGLEAEDGEAAVAGLAYRARAVTLAREGGNPRGTAQGAKRRNVRVRLRLNRSAIPLVGGDRAVPERSTTTPMGSAEPLFTGDVEASASLGWSDGSVTIEQDLPRRTEILAVFANTAVHDL